MVNQIIVEEKGKNENKTCYASCDTQLYSLLITNANYPTKSTFKYTKEFCFIVKKLLKSMDNRRKVLSKYQPRLVALLDTLKVST